MGTRIIRIPGTRLVARIGTMPNPRPNLPQSTVGRSLPLIGPLKKLAPMKKLK